MEALGWTFATASAVILGRMASIGRDIEEFLQREEDRWAA